MDVLRLDLYRNDPAAAHRNAQRVFFDARYLRVHDGWALVCAVPINTAGKEIAEVRWALLRRQAGRWSDVHYFDAISLVSEEEGLDALGMSASTIRKVWRKFPGRPEGHLSSGQQTTSMTYAPEKPNHALQPTAFGRR